MKRKESGVSLSHEERSKMAAPSDVLVTYAEGTFERRLYNKFLREFINSSKLTRAQKTGGQWFADKKLKHVWRRYCGDKAYDDLGIGGKRRVMTLALEHAVDLHYTEDEVAEATEQDYAARETVDLRRRLVPGMPTKIAVALAEATANKLSGGIYGLVRIADNLKDGERRLAIAQTYAQRYSSIEATDQTDLSQIQSLDDEGALGAAASFLVMKLDRFQGRQAVTLAAQTLSVTGAAFGLVPIIGQGVEAALSAASGVMNAGVTLDQAFNNLKKRINGNLSVARETIAISLWGLGRRSHLPTLEFLSELGIIDGPNGLLAANGFFDRSNIRLAAGFIANQMKSTAQKGAR